MRRLMTVTLVVLTLPSLFVPTTASAAPAGKVASLQNTIDTSSWAKPSPDPTGVAWWDAQGHLLVVDSEVEETVGGISHYQGANTWEITTAGQVQRATDTLSFTSEPTDVAANGNRVFITDDNLDRVFIVRPGKDGLLNTADDTQTSFSSHAFKSYDVESISFANGELFVGDGSNTQVYRVDPGPDGSFGGADDRVTCFDTATLGMRDPEGVFVDPGSSDVYIASRRDREIAVADQSGKLLDLIDLRGVLDYGGRKIAPSGVTMAPASDNPARTDLYVSDRGVDNNIDPNENDGAIHEIRLSSPGGNLAPVVSSFGGRRAVEGERVDVRTVAHDPNGDPMSYSATGLPPGLSIDPSSGLISGRVGAGAAAGSPYVSHVSVSDGSLTTVRRVRWRITTGTQADRPPTMTPTEDQTNTVGDQVGLQIQASDPDAGQALMYSATGLPPGLWLDCTSGRIRGTIAGGADSGSPYHVRIQVEDQTIPADPRFRSKRDTESFTWTVNPAPTPGPISFVSASKGATRGLARRLKIPRPGGVAAGDVLVAGIDVRGRTRIDAPPGWKRVQANHRRAILRQFVYVHVVGDAEPRAYRWRFSHRQPASGVLGAYRGVDPNAPIETSGGRTRRRSRAIRAPSLTASDASSVLVGVFGVSRRARIRPASGMTERTEVREGRTRRRMSTELSDQQLTSTGRTGPRIARASRIGTTIGQDLILRPGP